MKRSRSVATLVLSGALPFIAACDLTPDADEAITIYPDQASCESRESTADCESAAREALLRHRQEARRFASLQACEREMGVDGCTAIPEFTGPEFTGSDSTVGEVFIPAMAGFMISHSLGSATAQPVYVDRKGFAHAGRTLLGPMPAHHRPARKEEEEKGSSVSGGGGGWYIGDDSSGKQAKPHAAAPSQPIVIKGRPSGFGRIGRAFGLSGG